MSFRNSTILTGSALGLLLTLEREQGPSESRREQGHRREQRLKQGLRGESRGESRVEARAGSGL